MKNKKKTKHVKAIYFTELTYKDLKKACVRKGMPFDQVAGADVPTLHNWLHNNRLNDDDNNLINEYDDWVEEELRNIGSEYLISPSLRLGYIGEKSDNETQVKKPKEKKERVPKQPKEKTAEGIVKGTKKAYTFELANKGRNLEFVIKRVLKRYPDASEKSIKIWYRSVSKNKK